MELCPNKKNYFSLFINHLVVKEFCFQNCFTLQENTEVLSRIHNYRSKLPIYYKSMSASCTSALLTGLSHQVTPVSDELLLSMISLCYDNQEIIVLKRLASVNSVHECKKKDCEIAPFCICKEDDAWHSGTASDSLLRGPGFVSRCSCSYNLSQIKFLLSYNISPVSSW